MPPPVQGGPGMPPPPPPSGSGGGKGMLMKILSGGAVVIVAIVFAIIKFFLGDSGTDKAQDQMASIPEGECLTQEDAEGSSTDIEAVSCDTAEAYYKVDKNVDVSDKNYERTFDTAEENRIIGEACGESFNVTEPGVFHSFGTYLYDMTSREIAQVLCLKALDKPDDEGRTPKVPEVGECFDSYDSTGWYTLDCSDENADAKVLEYLPLDPPTASTTEVETVANESCPSGTEFYGSLANLDEEATHVVCYAGP